MRFFILLFLLSCGTHKPVPVEDSSVWGKVRAKRDTYIELAKAQVDSYGWLNPPCDGLLFNSLAAYSGFPVNPMLAEREPGLWERHPAFDCYKGGAKGSSVSRDMFRGLFIYLLSMQDRDALIRVREYGKAHGWVMGSGEWSRTYFNPLIRNQLARMIDETEPRQEEEEDTIAYEDHLAVLGIYTEYLIYGKILDIELKTLEAYAKDHPRNALFQALYHKFSDGDQSRALEVLLDETLFPADRLPTEQDHFTHYLWQRDEDEDWQPCDPRPEQKRSCEGGLSHAGVDFIFAVAVIER
jgi:hypothetical protein